MKNEKYVETAIRWQKEHEYKQIASGDGCEVWLCKKPETVSFGFVIAEHPWGISVMGDIGNIQFYGINLKILADGSISYIGGKVPLNFKKATDIQMLHMISHAAKEIQKQKNSEEAK
ncbi:MAG: hypothetical protein JXQ76_07555 [Campylobacterales bacterium]|nr:hypothetical protein [Campylobacterales bacterium]